MQKRYLTSGGSIYNAPPRYTTPDVNTQLLYTLDEAGGAPYLNIGRAGALNLTVGGGTTPKQLWASVFTTGVRLLGVTDGLVSANTSVGETSTAWTASVWVYPLSFTANFAAFFGKQYRNDGTWTAPFQSVQMQWTNAGDGSWQAQTTIATAAKTVSCTALDQRLVLAKWQLLTLTSDLNTLSAYKDGTLMGTTALGTNVSTDWGTHGRWFFGGNPASTADRANVVLDDIRFENTCRSAGYIRRMWASATWL